MRYFLSRCGEYPRTPCRPGDHPGYTPGYPRGFPRVTPGDTLEDPRGTPRGPQGTPQYTVYSRTQRKSVHRSTRACQKADEIPKRGKRKALAREVQRSKQRSTATRKRHCQYGDVHTRGKGNTKQTPLIDRTNAVILQTHLPSKCQTPRETPRPSYSLAWVEEVRRWKEEEGWRQCWEEGVGRPVG